MKVEATQVDSDSDAIQVIQLCVQTVARGQLGLTILPIHQTLVADGLEQNFCTHPKRCTQKGEECPPTSFRTLLWMGQCMASSGAHSYQPQPTQSQWQRRDHINAPLLSLRTSKSSERCVHCGHHAGTKHLVEHRGEQQRN